MPAIKNEWILYGVGLGVGLLLLNRMMNGALIQGMGSTIGRVPFDAGAGVVYGIGDAVGVPRTSPTKCQQDIAAGRTWDASFSCPAPDFIKYMIGG